MSLIRADNVENQEPKLNLRVRPGEDLYPFCLVWTPIPFLTWIFPFVGHMGICNSEGITYDFAGSFYISEGNLAFGKTTRYIQLRPLVATSEWDKAVAASNACYAKRHHNLCIQNCHSHCATVLDTVSYSGFHHWNMIILAMWMFIFGRFTSFSGFLWSFLPSIVIYGIIIAGVTSK